MNPAMFENPCVKSRVRLHSQKTPSTSWRIVPTSTSPLGNIGAVTPHREIYRQHCERVYDSLTPLSWLPGSLTVTYVSGDRSVMGGNMCVSSHQVCSAPMETDHIWKSKKSLTVMLWYLKDPQGNYKYILLKYVRKIHPLDYALFLHMNWCFFDLK